METKAGEVTKVIFDEMKKQGLSYRKFAEKIGCHYMTIYQWKKHQIRLDVADKALKALGISVTIGADK